MNKETLKRFQEPAEPEQFGLPRSPIFDGLPVDALESLAGAGKRRRLAAGSTIYSEGERAESLFMVVEGEVRRFKTNLDSPRKNQFTLGSVQPGGLFGEASLTRRERWDSAEAVGDVTLLEWSSDDIISAMVRTPLFGVAVSQSVVNSVVSAEGKVCNFGSGQWSHKRLAQALSALASAEGEPAEGGIRIKRPITQGDLASIIGSARETVSISMKRLREAGAISVSGKTITIHPAIQSFL
jgi:CRP-like cAMP-binding protein